MAIDLSVGGVILIVYRLIFFASESAVSGRPCGEINVQMTAV